MVQKNLNLNSFFKHSFIILLLLLSACNNSENKDTPENGVIEAYTPKNKIDFPHTIHAKNNIDCKYCHNYISKSDRKEQKESICLDCHKNVQGK
ncbi:MAG: cytochrome c3 family protein [Fluviicola sp.]